MCVTSNNQRLKHVSNVIAGVRSVRSSSDIKLVSSELVGEPSNPKKECYPLCRKRRWPSDQSGTPSTKANPFPSEPCRFPISRSQSFCKPGKPPKLVVNRCSSVVSQTRTPRTDGERSEGPKARMKVKVKNWHQHFRNFRSRGSHNFNMQHHTRHHISESLDYIMHPRALYIYTGSPSLFFSMHIQLRNVWAPRKGGKEKRQLIRE
jgi:hypothetical protein